jgi:hypothetical protein
MSLWDLAGASGLRGARLVGGTRLRLPGAVLVGPLLLSGAAQVAGLTQAARPTGRSS